MRLSTAPRPVSSHAVRGVAVALAMLALLVPATSRATFHLWEITKIMTSHDGDATVQAVEMKVLAAGENLVNTASLVVYDAAGTPGATLGTFAADLPAGGAVVGAHILFATMKFKQRFGITPDIQIPAGLLQTNGQVAFQKPTCTINAVAYGAIVTPIGGNVSAAPPLPTGDAPILVRTTDNAIFPSCPQAEDAAAHFQLRTATPTVPITFTNYSGVTVNVTSTVTGVGDGTTLAPAARVYPNPFRGSIRVESPGPGQVTVYNAQGARVRTLARSGSGGAYAAFRGDWDGRDDQGKAVAAGVYFIRFESERGAEVRRVAFLR